MLKRHFAALVITLLPSLVLAGEFQPGTIELTGSSTLDLGSDKNEMTRKVTGLPDETEKWDSSNVDLELGALYYVTPNFGVGFEVGYTRDRQKQSPITDTDTAYMFGPKVGIDFGLAEKTSVFAEAALLFTKANWKEEDTSDPLNDYDYDGSGFAFGVAAGLKYFPAPAFSLNAGVRYLAASLTTNPDPSVEYVQKSSGVGAFAGVSIYFGR